MLKSILTLGAIAATMPGAVLAQAAPAAKPIPRAAFIAEMDRQFAAMDLNRDGTATTAEIGEAQKRAVVAEAARQNRRIFDKLDADKNGSVTAAEFAKLVRPDAFKPDPAPVLSRFDGNRDGKVTQIEYRTATQANFDRRDTDRDGIVTAAEMRAAAAARK